VEDATIRQVARDNILAAAGFSLTEQCLDSLVAAGFSPPSRLSKCGASTSDIWLPNKTGALAPEELLLQFGGFTLFGQVAFVVRPASEEHLQRFR
jgi:hypothetical protein